MTEHQMYEAIAQYLQVKYPNVLYRFDLAADIKLTMGQARRHKILHPRRGWPDLFIAETSPACVDGSWNYDYYGLFIEIKKDGTRLKKKNGDWATPHIEEQAEMLDDLRNKGYMAEFSVGIDNTIKLIDSYLEISNES